MSSLVYRVPLPLEYKLDDGKDSLSQTTESIPSAVDDICNVTDVESISIKWVYLNYNHIGAWQE